MDLVENRFKRGLHEGRHQVGVWCTLGGTLVPELLAGSGFDWIVLDTEHSPGDPVTTLPQLQAVAAYPASAVVRPAWNDTVLIKRFLDAGAQTLLIPFVQTAEEAAQAVAATRFPPRGVRGVATMTRATRFGRMPEYARRADEEICVLVQIETGEALEQLEAIAAVEGVDGVFIGPSDLSASLGHPGEAGHPAVVGAIEDAIGRLGAVGTPAGILTPDPAFAKRCIALGTRFTAVGIDAALLARASEALAASFR